MASVFATEPPAHSLIATFAEARDHYCDAFSATAPRNITLPDLILAFYTTPLFRAERLVLSVAGLPCSDSEIEALATGHRLGFAAWRVEARRPHEILLADVSGRTKSWLAVRPRNGETSVWFGSVIVPKETGKNVGIGPVFRLLLRPHRMYSRALLRAAVSKLSQSGKAASSG